MNTVVSKIVLTVFLIGLISISLFAIVLERSDLDTGTKQFLLSKKIAPSTTNAFNQLSECDQQLTSVFFKLGSAAEIEDRATDCLNLTRAVEETRPLQGFPPYVQAAAELTLGRLEQARRSLDRSQRLAPNESWLAAKRALFRVDFLEGEDAFENELFWKDIEIAIRRPDTHQSIVALYFDFEAVKVELPSIIERQSPQVQRQMLNSIRRAASGAN